MAHISLQRIATQAGLSKMTVSRALRDAPAVSAATRARVKQIAAELGYVADIRVSSVMSAFRKSETPLYRETLAFVVTHPSWMAAAEAKVAAAAALELGYRLDVVHAWEHGGGGEKFARVLEARGIRGVLLAPNASLEHRQFDLPWERFSVVLLGSSLVNEGLPRVRSSHFQGTLLALSKTFALGYRKVGMLVERSMNERTGRSMSAAFFTADHPGGVAWAGRALRFREGDGDDSWKAWLDEVQPDALIVEGAHRLAELVAHVGPIPEKLAVVGLDVGVDQREVAGICQNWEEIARTAVRVLTSWVRSERRGLYPLASVTSIPGTWRDGRSSPRVQRTYTA